MVTLDEVIAGFEREYMYIPAFEFNEVSGLYEASIVNISVPALRFSMELTICSAEPVKIDARRFAIFNPDKIFISYNSMFDSATKPSRLPENSYDGFAERVSRESTDMERLSDYFNNLSKIQHDMMRFPMDRDPLVGKDLEGKKVTVDDIYRFEILQGNLRWLKTSQGYIPYVLTLSETIGGVGMPHFGLFFVARDKADVEWKQKLVAYHETLCQTIGHEFALKMEVQYADLMGIPKAEYAAWRKELRSSKSKY